MSAAVNISHNARFKAGRIILLVAAALMTLNHAVLVFALDDPVLFMGYAAFNLYALHVWAWENNPSGIYKSWNPRVNCDNAA